LLLCSNGLPHLKGGRGSANSANERLWEGMTPWSWESRAQVGGSGGKGRSCLAEGRSLIKR
jgi:hypothetical protein